MTRFLSPGDVPLVPIYNPDVVCRRCEARAVEARLVALRCDEGGIASGVIR